MPSTRQPCPNAPMASPIQDDQNDRMRPLLRNEACANPSPRWALMSRLWTGFFGTARCRYPEKFSKPGFQPKMA